jgi:hypothetical protein
MDLSTRISVSFLVGAFVILIMGMSVPYDKWARARPYLDFGISLFLILAMMSLIVGMWS